MSSGAKKAISVLIAIALSAAGVYLFDRYDRHMLELSKQSLEWPSTTGLIIHSELKTRVSKLTRSSSGSKTKHEVRIRYEYVVDGEVFRNDDVRFDQNNLTRSRKERLVGTYPEGKQVAVYYDPENPGRSVLVPGSYR